MKAFILILFCVVSFSWSLSAKAFHLLMLGDTIDEPIEVGVRKNMINIEQSFSYISSVSKLPIHIKKFTNSDDTLTGETILKWIRKAPITADDIIILYYSGHGWREHTSPTIWPSGNFPNETRIIDMVDFSEIAQRIFAKKPCFCLFLFDCCNVLIPKDFQSTDSAQSFDFKKINPQISKESIKKLFLRKHGFIAASATSPTEVGWYHAGTRTGLQALYGVLIDDAFIDSTPWLGGVFTKSFLNDLFYELQSPHPCWLNILKKTQEACSSKTGNSDYKLSQDIINDYNPPHSFQTPQYRICLHKKQRKPDVYNRYFCKNNECENNPTEILQPELTQEEDSFLETPLVDILPQFLILKKHEKPYSSPFSE